MTYLLALLIFLAITSVIWFVAVAVYQALVGEPALRHNANFSVASCVSISLVTLISLMPFPAGYVFSLVVWALAAWGMLELQGARAWTLFLTLGALSMISRLAVLGAIGF